LLHDSDRLGWQAWMRGAGLKNAGPGAGPIFEDFNLLRAAALAGQGLALCPASLISDDIASGRLVKLFDTTINNDLAYYLIEAEPPADLGRATALAIFKDWLLRQATG
jgi:DNA-binding transcriptional LysR family regulator